MFLFLFIFSFAFSEGSKKIPSFFVSFVSKGLDRESFGCERFLLRAFEKKILERIFFFFFGVVKIYFLSNVFFFERKTMSSGEMKPFKVLLEKYHTKK